MDGDPYDHQGGLASSVGAGVRFVLTAGLAVVGVLAAVALAGRETESPERSRAPAVVVTPSPAHEQREFRLSGTAAPAAYLFIVATDAARLDLLSAIEGETVVRMATHEPARRAWVVAAETDSEAQALTDIAQGDAGIAPGGDVVAVAVIDLRLR